jgi:hypothetical protein
MFNGQLHACLFSFRSRNCCFIFRHGLAHPFHLCISFVLDSHPALGYHPFFLCLAMLPAPTVCSDFVATVSHPLGSVAASANAASAGASTQLFGAVGTLAVLDEHFSWFTNEEWDV